MKTTTEKVPEGNRVGFVMSHCLVVFYYRSLTRPGETLTVELIFWKVLKIKHNQ